MNLQALNAAFERVSAMLLRQQVKPLPTLVYEFSAIHEALRQFSAAKHVGKIVVKLLAVAETSHNPSTGSGSRGAWVVTGGLGALGTIAAKWLAGQGKQNLHLLGRSGRQALVFAHVMLHTTSLQLSAFLSRPQFFSFVIAAKRV